MNAMNQSNYPRWTIVFLKLEGRFEDLNASFMNLLSEKCYQKRWFWKSLIVMGKDIPMAKQKSLSNF